MDTNTLPSGNTVVEWELEHRIAREWIVDAEAGDDAEGDGSAAHPWRTIQHALDQAQPGEAVRIRPGVYRETVRPRRGGSGPEAMIHLLGEPGAVVSGADVIAGGWRASTQWRWQGANQPPAAWEVRLPRDAFVGVNPFNTPNRAHFGTLGGFDQTKARNAALLALKCGMLFQDDRQLTQVTEFVDLAAEPGRFWVDPGGLLLHVRPFDDVKPDAAMWEFTARAQAIVPDQEQIDYLRIAGLSVVRCGNRFPFFPQEGAISTNRGRRWIIEDCTVDQINAVGIDAGWRDPRMVKQEPAAGHRIRRNTVRRCGVCGIAGLGMFDAIIEDNLVEDCCWHDIEEMWESAAIKTHNNRRTIVRRNLVRRAAHGCGIWLDFTNHDSRCTQNVVHSVTSLFGGVFVEASHVPNRVDHNVIFDSRAVAAGGGHGVYAHDTDYLTVESNLFACCEGSAVHLPKGQPDRWVEGRGSVSRKHVVRRNVVVDCGRAITLACDDSESDENVFAGLRLPGPFRLDDVNEWLDLKAWRDFHGLDGGSVEAELGVEMCAAEGGADASLRIIGSPPADRGPAWAMGDAGQVCTQPRQGV